MILRFSIIDEEVVYYDDACEGTPSLAQVAGAGVEIPSLSLFQFINVFGE